MMIIMYVYFESINHEHNHEQKTQWGEASPNKIHHGFAPKPWLTIHFLSWQWNSTGDLSHTLPQGGAIIGIWRFCISCIYTRQLNLSLVRSCSTGTHQVLSCQCCLILFSTRLLVSRGIWKAKRNTNFSVFHLRRALHLTWSVHYLLTSHGPTFHGNANSGPLGLHFLHNCVPRA